MKKVLGYLSEVKAELTKVTWPKRDEVVKLTLLVLSISAIVGLFVGGLDFVYTKLLTLFVTR